MTEPLLTIKGTVTSVEKATHWKAFCLESMGTVSLKIIVKSSAQEHKEIMPGTVVFAIADKIVPKEFSNSSQLKVFSRDIVIL